MAKLKKTLPKNFRELIVTQDWDTLKAELLKCEKDAYERGGTEHILFARALDKRIEKPEDVYRATRSYGYGGRNSDLYDYLSIDMIEWLVKDWGCDVGYTVKFKLKNTTHTCDFHPLEVYIEWGKTEIVEKLLELGADPNGLSYCWFRPIDLACRDDKRDIIELLISYGANPVLSQYYCPINDFAHHAIKDECESLDESFISTFNLLFTFWENDLNKIEKKYNIETLYYLLKRAENQSKLQQFSPEKVKIFKKNLSLLITE